MGNQKERVLQAIKAEKEASRRNAVMRRMIGEMQLQRREEEEESRICSDASKSSSTDDIRTNRQRRVNRASLERERSEEEREELQDCDRFEEIRNLEMQRCLRVCEVLKQKLM